MDKRIIEEAGRQLSVYYQRIKTILLNPVSYSNDPKIENVTLYFEFLESALLLDVPRVYHLYTFIDDQSCSLMTEFMIPFCYLTKEALREIESVYYLTVWTYDGLDEYDSDAGAKLGNQPHFIPGRPIV